jgi:hypothetical protein
LLKGANILELWGDYNSAAFIDEAPKTALVGSALLLSILLTPFAESCKSFGKRRGKIEPGRNDHANPAVDETEFPPLFEPGKTFLKGVRAVKGGGFFNMWSNV